MKLERLTIATLPGIAEGFSLDGLAPGINLVTGPNTIGKSSLVRALKYLLREHERGDPPVSLSAEFTDGASHWRVERTGSVTAWIRDGQDAERPALPVAEELGRYCMSMEDLIKAGDADEALAVELWRAMRGGFDLSKARLSIGQRHGNKEDRELREARRLLRAAEQTANSLSEREDELPKLNAKIRQASEAEAQCRQIERAKELCGVIGERESLRAALDQFPKDMEKLVGREEEELDKLRKRVKKLRNDERDEGSQRDRDEAEIDRLGFSGKNLDEADHAQTLVEDKLNEIERLRGELERLRQDELGQRARLEDAVKELGGNGSPQLDSATLVGAEALAARLVQLRTVQSELETKIQIAGTAPDEREIKQHDKAIEALRDWLKSQSNTNSSRPVGRTLLASLVAGSLAAATGLLVHPLAGAGLTLLSVFLIVIALRQLRPAADMRQPVAREHFDATGLAAPSAWREEEVSERLRALEEVVGDLLATKSRAEGADGLRIDLENTTEELERNEQDRAELAKSIGFDPAMPITGYDRFIRLVQNWDREREAVLETANLIAERALKLEASTAVLGKLLAPWVDELQTDFDSLKASAASLKSRLGQARKHAEELRGAENRIAGIKAHLAICEQDIQGLYERAGLAAGDEPALRARLDLLPSWKEKRAEYTGCSTSEAQIRKGMEGSTDLCELAEAQNAAELDRILDLRQSTAQQRDSLIEQREQTRAEIKQAESGGTIAEAITKRTQAQAALESKRDELLDAVATDLLLDKVEATYSADHEPEILREAGSLFHQVTAHEFELELGEGGGFQARDLKQNAVRKLDELSTGTRMQLLLAVRTAWVGRHKSLPLFLDEALTTSDEERTTEVVRSLRTLAEAGGAQVVYFSARRNEAALWRAALGDDFCVIDLGEARGQVPDAEAATFTLEPRRPVPAPSGTPEEYARALAVPHVDPRRDAGEIHLFHLLRDDLELLHSLMRDCRFTSLGQFQSMLENQTVNLDGADEGRQARLLARCHAARVWLDAWREGRGKEIGRNELESSGAITDIFLDRAVSLLESSDVEGESARFLSRLRDGALRGFRQNRIEELEAWLREAQYLDERPELSAAERRAKVLFHSDASDPADAADINQCIDWLEAGLARTQGKGRK